MHAETATSPAIAEGGARMHRSFCCMGLHVSAAMAGRFRWPRPRPAGESARPSFRGASAARVGVRVRGVPRTNLGKPGGRRGTCESRKACSYALWGAGSHADAGDWLSARRLILRVTARIAVGGGE